MRNIFKTINVRVAICERNMIYGSISNQNQTNINGIYIKLLAAIMHYFLTLYILPTLSAMRTRDTTAIENKIW